MPDLASSYLLSQLCIFELVHKLLQVEADQTMIILLGHICECTQERLTGSEVLTLLTTIELFFTGLMLSGPKISIFNTAQ